MTTRRTLTDDLALMILARDGIAAIWQLNLEAAEAYRTGTRLLRSLFWRWPMPRKKHGSEPRE